jgi:hypothetical protein
VVMGWLYSGYRVVIQWLWGGYTVVIGWSYSGYGVVMAMCGVFKTLNDRPSVPVCSIDRTSVPVN